MWEHNKEINYVPIEHLCGYFEPKYSLLVKLFFEQSIILFIFLDNITYHKFFVFVCSFMFLNLQQILPILLSMCHINSNIMINVEQMELFCEIFGLDGYLTYLLNNLREKELDIMYINIIYSSPTTIYPIKDFNNLILYCSLLIDNLNEIRYTLVNLTIQFESLSNIFKRIDFYSDHSIHESPPSECFLTKLNRIFVLKIPPPYEFTYYIPTPKMYISEVVTSTRQLFGYSRRKVSTKTCSTKLLNISSSGDATLLESPNSSSYASICEYSKKTFRKTTRSIKVMKSDDKNECTI